MIVPQFLSIPRLLITPTAGSVILTPAIPDKRKIQGHPNPPNRARPTSGALRTDTGKPRAGEALFSLLVQPNQLSTSLGLESEDHIPLFQGFSRRIRAAATAPLPLFSQSVASSVALCLKASDFSPRRTSRSSLESSWADHCGFVVLLPNLPMPSISTRWA